MPSGNSLWQMLYICAICKSPITISYNGLCCISQHYPLDVLINWKWLFSSFSHSTSKVAAANVWHKRPIRMCQIGLCHILQHYPRDVFIVRKWMLNSFGHAIWQVAATNALYKSPITLSCIGICRILEHHPLDVLNITTITGYNSKPDNISHNQ